MKTFHACSSHRLALAGLAMVALVTHAHACRIPVFRYALERWDPGRFQAVVVHSQPLSADEEALVERLRTRSAAEDNSVNVDVILLPLATGQEPGRPGETGSPEETNRDKETNRDNSTSPVSLSPEELRLVDGATSPMLLLRFPPTSGTVALAWSGPLTEANVDGVLNSPLRTEVVRRLLEGESAVWVLLECGEPARDDAAAQTLERELLRMQQTITLPALEELAQEEEFLADTTVPLRLAFSVLRLPRQSQEEAVFRSMLLASEPDLATFDEPIAIPIYGRGRTYYALVGKGIKASTIESNSRFVCGDCSCQIKEQNPGVDLLLAANWDANVQGPSLLDRDVPELTGIGSLDVIDLGTVESMADADRSELATLAAGNTVGSSSSVTNDRTGAELAATGTSPTAHAGAAVSAAGEHSSTSAAPQPPPLPWKFGMTGILLVCILALGLAVGFASVLVLGKSRRE